VVRDINGIRSCEIGFVGESNPKAALVAAKLAFRQAQVTAIRRAGRAVGRKQPLQGIEEGAWPVIIA
jgi:hypothetical protein